MQPKKSLGQNFLTQGKIVDDIIAASDVTASDIVLEVGPGKGILTAKLLVFAGKVIAVEKDDRLIPHLQEIFSTNIAKGNLELIHADILDFDLSHKLSNLQTYKLIANIPYYITGALIRKFLESKIQPTHMTLMLQKEVAERILARDSKESLLSISVKAYGKPKLIRTVGAAAFFPKPNVDSAILVIEDISKDFFKDFSEEYFFSVLKAGFAHKRKKLIGNLKDIFPKEKVEKAFSNVKISKDIRAEDLELNEWRSLAKNLAYSDVPTV